MPASPQHFTLSADVEKTFTLDQNCGTVRIVVYANPATVFFNTKNVAVPAVASSQDGNQVIPGVLSVVEVADESAGGVSVVRVRSAGTPTIAVSGW